MPACMPWRSRPRRRANEVQRDGQEARPISLMAPPDTRNHPGGQPARRTGSWQTIDDRHQRAVLIKDGPLVVARKERLKSSTRVLGQRSIGFVYRRWCHNFAAAPHGFPRRSVANVAVDVGSHPKTIVDHVRLRKSTWRGGVDMQAIVSAICAHAGHEPRACFLCYSRFRCWATRR
jgi:hypothetical protein